MAWQALFSRLSMQRRKCSLVQGDGGRGGQAAAEFDVAGQFVFVQQGRQPGIDSGGLPLHGAGGG